MINYHLIRVYMTQQPIQLPDSIIEDIRQLQGTAEGYQFLIGDYLADVCDEFTTVYPGDRHVRANIIRYIANRIGCDASTLRDRESVARFVTKDMRSEYPFSWSQWRAIKSAGPEWEKYARWAADSLPCPVTLIYKQIKHGDNAPPVWIGRWERVIELSEELQSDEQAPPGVRLAARLISMGVLG